MSGSSDPKANFAPLAHMFIDFPSGKCPKVNSRMISSQARRVQCIQKRRQQSVTALREAVYARSLVGWRLAASTLSTTSCRSLPSDTEKQWKYAQPGLEEINSSDIEGQQLVHWDSSPSTNSNMVVRIGEIVGQPF